MQILKSSRDAIGTAAGVAWPTFGIVFNTLALTMGGVSAIVLGSFSLSLFLIVAFPIAYWSYKNHFEEKRILHFNMVRERELINAILLAYLINTIKNYLIKNHTIFITSALRDQLKEKIFRDTQTIFKRTSKLEKDLDAFLKKFTNILIYNHDPSKIEILKKLISRFINTNEKSIYFQPPSIRSQIRVAGMCFTASFGSIAGCMAGMIGLLVGVGLLMGLAAVPIVGWASLGVALIFGVATAAHSVQSYRKKYKKNQMISFYKEINKHFINTNKFINAKFSTEKNRKFHNNNLPSLRQTAHFPVNRKVLDNKNLSIGLQKKETTPLIESNSTGGYKLKRK